MSEVKKIKRGDFWMLDADEAWDHVNALQTELDRLEQVVKQGFVPDWSKAPEDARGVSIRFVDYDEDYWSDLVADWSIQYIPRPAPKTGGRTREQLCLAWVKWAEKNSTSAWIPEMELATRLANGEKLEDLCRAAGIDLTVTEE